MAAFPELPSVKELRSIVLRHAGKSTYNTDDMKAIIRQELKLTDDLLNITMSNGANALDNRVDWVTARMTMEGLHRGEKKIYRLTKEGQRAAREECGGQPVADHTTTM